MSSGKFPNSLSSQFTRLGLRCREGSPLSWDGSWKDHLPCRDSVNLAIRHSLGGDKRLMICIGLLHVSCNLLERSKPNAGVGFHVSDQLL